MQRSKGRELLPRAVAVLGELGPCVLHDPNSSRFFELPFEPGRVLCSSDDGRELFILHPKPGRTPVRLSDQALRAAELHERFVHRAANEFYNCVVPPFRAPRFAGELVIVRYSIEKDLEELVPEDHAGVAEWEHYFEEPGIAPAYPQVWSVGSGQFYVPPGPFAVKPEGITFAKEKRP